MLVNMLLLLSITFYAITACDAQVYKTTPQGKLVGKSGLDRKGNVYHSFLSIPYAKPPVGNLRFEPPIEAGPWNGTLNATAYRAVCPQWEKGRSFGEEDCLHINVYTPENKHCPKSLKPVMVYIHGGGLIVGSSQTFGPTFLMQECILLVTPNYRLGILGFVNSDDETLGIPGNLGLKDQVMALRWVNKYIRHFGGDPGNVMLVGESIGGGCVHLHMLSPLSKGLFHKVVSMSGSAEQAWAVGMRNTLRMFGERIGIHAEDPKEILRLLKLVPSDVITTKGQNNLSVLRILVHTPNEANLVIEPDIPGAFISARPLDIINSGNYSNVPFMIGYTDQEGTIGEVLHRLELGTRFEITNFSRVVPQNVNHEKHNTNEMAEDIRRFYFGDEEITWEKSLLLYGDVWYYTGIPVALNAHVRQNKAPVYLYRFSADTDLNYIKRLTPETVNCNGTLHAEDISYLFNTTNTPRIRPNSKEDIAISNVVKLFGDFARYGRPAQNWLPVTSQKLHFMDIGIYPVPGVNPDMDRYNFWSSFYKKYL